MNYILLSFGIMAVFVLCMVLITAFLYRMIAKTGMEEKKTDNAGYHEKMFGKDEIADLVKSFNSMETALKKQMKNVAIMTAENEKVRTELSVATRIQADMIPVNFAEVTKSGMCDLFGSMRPAKEVGGDFYDFFAPDEEHLCMVIGDVSGKGVPAALFMTKSKIYIKQRAMQGGSPAQILSDVNSELCIDNQEMLFVTVLLGIVNTKTGEMAYCSAGHEYPIICCGKECRCLNEDKNDPPLALEEGIPFVDRKARLNKGEKLFLYTDGIPEAKNERGERYTIDRMLETLRTCERNTSCEDVAHMMGKEMDLWMANEEPFDDMTMLIFGMNEG